MTTTVIAGATVVAGRELEALPHASITVEDERIVAVDPESQAITSGEPNVVDARSLTLIPAFIDCHVHIGFFPPRAVLLGGVTAVRDLAWPAADIFPLANASRAPDFDGPLVLASGPMITVPGGYPTRASWAPPGTGLPVDSPQDARAAVATLADWGACVVKTALNPAVGPTLSRALLAAVVDAAHGQGLSVTAHVYGLDELTKALDARVDELAHVLLSPERIPEEVTLRMVNEGVSIVPTISCLFGRTRRIAVGNLSRFRAAGGHVVYGTDLGNRGPRPGIDPRELAGMKDAGYTAREILRAATVDAADHLQLEDSGVIEPERYADLVAVGGDPLANAGDLSNVRMVWHRGRRVR